MKFFKPIHRTFSLFLSLLMVLQLATIAGANNRTILPMEIKTTAGEKIGSYKESHALVIGVSDYTAGWSDLESIPGEILKLETTLKNQGFSVTKVMDPNSKQLKKSFRDFIDTYGFEPDNRLLIFFSGHGYTRKQGTKGYLVPTDAPSPLKDDRGFARKGLPMSQILAWARHIESKHVLFLFDSCFSGAIFKAKGSPNTPTHIREMTALPVRQFITAGKAGETVPARSVFTPMFIDAIQYGEGDLNKDGYVSGVELGLHLHIEVPKHAKQTPQFGKIMDYELSRGDFIFRVATPKRSSLVIKTKPTGATVTVDGEPRGEAPVTVLGLSPGRVVVHAEKTGYAPQEERVLMRAGRDMDITLVLDKTVTKGGLILESIPTGAKWYLDDDYAGTTPDKMPGISPGFHTVSVKKTGYQNWNRSIEVEMGRFNPLLAKLEKADYGLTVQTTPSNATVRILNIGPRYRAGMSLKPGNYHVEVSKSGYKQVKQWVKIVDQDVTVPIRLKTVSTPMATYQTKNQSSSTTSSRSWSDPTTGMEFVKIPEGCFNMGSDSYSDEKPVHEVCVDGFWMGKYEVTNGQYRKFKSNHNSLEYKGYSFNGDQQPVVYVSWKGAKAYSDWLSKKGNGIFRLPTEAEWEYAARAGTQTERYWGDGEKEACQYANVLNPSAKKEFDWSWATAFSCEDNYQVTAPVGKFRANQFGLYDMLGNVWEWVNDWYDGDKYYAKSPKKNPKGPSKGSYRVNRGGSWSGLPAIVRSAIRSSVSPDNQSVSLGFRLLRQP